MSKSKLEDSIGGICPVCERRIDDCVCEPGLEAEEGSFVPVLILGSVILAGLIVGAVVLALRIIWGLD